LYTAYGRGIVVKKEAGFLAARNVRTSRRVRAMEKVADSQMSGGSVVLRIDEDRGERHRRGNFFFILT